MGRAEIIAIFIGALDTARCTSAATRGVLCGKRSGYDCSQCGLTRFAIGITAASHRFLETARRVFDRHARRRGTSRRRPVADAVEQQRTAVEPVPDEEASADRPVDVPLEVAPADWQEQFETVELDPEFDQIDR